MGEICDEVELPREQDVESESIHIWSAVPYWTNPIARCQMLSKYTQNCSSTVEESGQPFRLSLGPRRYFELERCSSTGSNRLANLEPGRYWSPVGDILQSAQPESPDLPTRSGRVLNRRTLSAVRCATGTPGRMHNRHCPSWVRMETTHRQPIVSSSTQLVAGHRGFALPSDRRLRRGREREIRGSGRSMG